MHVGVLKGYSLDYQNKLIREVKVTESKAQHIITKHQG